MLNDEHLNELRDVVGTDKLAEVLRLYIHATAEMLDHLESSVANEDQENLRRAAHTLKGSAANVGARGLIDAAQTVLSACDAGDADGARDRARAVRPVATRLCAQLEARLVAWGA